MSNDPDDYEGNVINLKSTPYTEKIKVEQVIENGVIRFKPYKVIKIKVPIDETVSNGDFNMTAMTKVNLTSSQTVGQLAKDLNL